MKKLYLLAITFVIAGLMITSATSIPVTNDSEETEMTPEYVWLPVQRVSAVKTSDSQGDMAPLFVGNQITAGDYDSYRPAMAADPSGRFFASFDGTEDGSVYYPILTYSLDGGTTWGDFAYFPDSAGATKPDVDFKPTGFYATFSPPWDYNGQIWVIDASVIDDPAGSYWDFGSYNLNEFTDTHIATYTHAGPDDDGAWNWGGLAMTGYNGYNGADVVGCPYVFYQTNAEGSGVIGWLNNAAGCEHATTDIDLVTNMSYSVYDREVTGQYQILVRKDNFGTWTQSGDYYSHPNAGTKTLVGTGNLTYPDVIADSGNILIVVQSDEAGNQDIVCYYSTNGGTSYAPVVVANDPADELYPQITWIKTGVAVCTYMRGSEAYYKATEDFGATWSTEQRVSDEQITTVEDHAMTISGMNGNAYAIWQDGRGGILDIFWDSFYNVASPNVQIGTVAGGVGKVTMEVLNTGTGAATDIDWSISVKGGILGRINVTTTGTIASLAAGASQVVQTNKFIFGLGSITIQLTAGQAVASKTGKVTLFFVRKIA